MSHLLLLPESPRSRCVGTPIFTGENTLALLDCTCARVHVFVRSRFMQPQFPGKNRAFSNESAKFDCAPKALLRGLVRFIKLVERNIELSLLTTIGIAYSESKSNCGALWIAMSRKCEQMLRLA